MEQVDGGEERYTCTMLNKSCGCAAIEWVGRIPEAALQMILIGFSIMCDVTVAKTMAREGCEKMI